MTILDREDQARYERDPVVYEALERLQNAHDEVDRALEQLTTQLCVRIDPPTAGPWEMGGPTGETLAGTKGWLSIAEARYTDAVATIEGLIAEREKGGDE